VSETERADLIERLVQVTGDAGYAQEARGWTLEELRETVAEEEAAAEAVRLHGRLGAVWRADARDYAALARRR
jgi:ethanolamine ammonia-lyase large subunit